MIISLLIIAGLIYYIFSLNTEKENMKKENDATKQKNAQLQTSNSELNDNISKLQATTIKLEMNLTNLQANHTELKANHTELKTNHTELESKFTELKIESEIKDNLINNYKTNLYYLKKHRFYNIQIFLIDLSVKVPSSNIISLGKITGMSYIGSNLMEYLHLKA